MESRDRMEEDEALKEASVSQIRNAVNENKIK